MRKLMRIIAFAVLLPCSHAAVSGVDDPQCWPADAQGSDHSGAAVMGSIKASKKDVPIYLYRPKKGHHVKAPPVHDAEAAPVHHAKAAAANSVEANSIEAKSAGAKAVGPDADQPSLQRETQLLNLRAEDAWSVIPVPPPQSTILTAVIDTGVLMTHPGLRTNLIKGFDFTCGQPSCGVPDDLDGHGTHMSGIIAANDAQFGVRGVAWNTHILPLRIFIGAVSRDSWAAAAIRQAITSGASVINASWMSPCPLPKVEQAIKDAAQAGVLFVVAAGNGGNDIEKEGNHEYPAMYGGPDGPANVIVVLGHGHDNRLSGASNFGKHKVELAAPDGSYTTNRCPPGLCYAVGGPGTSDATAYVAGAAALLKSVHPTWSAVSLKKHLIESAKPENALQPDMVEGKRLMLDRALLGPLHVTSPSPGTNVSASQPLQIKWSADYDSSFCTKVAISITTGGSSTHPLGNAVPNNGTTSIPAGTLTPGSHAVMTLTCDPGEFAVKSGEFNIGR